MAVDKLFLNGAWHLECLSSQQKVLPGDVFNIDVPGDVHKTLIEDAIIPDPFWAENYKQCDWVSRCDWLIYRDFTVDALFKGKKLELVFNGIDTYSSVRLNGVLLGSTENMFLQYVFDVTDKVKYDEPNRIEVEIYSTRGAIEKCDSTGYFACFNVERIFSRRIQCQFGWDWAPDLLSIGIWRDVYLRTVTSGTIKDVYARGDDSGAALFDVSLNGLTTDTKETTSSNLFIEIELSDDQDVYKKVTPVTGQKNFIDLKVPSPKLWWPNGYGDAHLYDYKITLKEGKRLLDKFTGRLGFRTVELIQEPLVDNKRSFRFKINGQPVFCMGANWVPPGCFTGCLEEDVYWRLITLARDANLNTLRVWGGGMYENDMFYDFCDEMGILVWQDMMFACGDIPDDKPEFVDEVVKEFKYQVKRLRNHPCIFHWCGGNEKTGAFGKLVKRGDLITKITAPGIIRDYIPTATYTPSSPFSYSSISNDPHSGDTHGGTYEEAFADDIAEFRKHIDRKRTVFMSEFGLHGPPEIRSLKKFIPDDSLWPLNGIWESHVQDNPYNSIPETFVQIQQACAEQLFYKPLNISDFIKTAGTFHAEYLYAEFQHHRRRLPENSGAMIWMLNDCWPAANWSVVDFYGQPKQAYYALKRACKPVMISFRDVNKKIELYVTNNSGSTIAGQITLSLQNVDGTQNKLIEHTQISVDTNDSRVVIELDKKSLGKMSENCYLLASLETEGQIQQEIFFHNLWKDILWPEPGLSMKILSEGWSDGRYSAVCRLKAMKFARCVNITPAEDVHMNMSDNYFDIPAGQFKDIVISSAHKFKTDQLVIHHWLTNWHNVPSKNPENLETVSKD